MPDAMMLSVGGTLSVGGMGEAGFRYGAQVDHVLTLDVVTGTGQLVTCSANHEPELFNMTLAGLGQCGVIVRARLRLTPAPRFIVTYALTYSDLPTFLADQARLAESGVPNLLNGRLNQTAQGAWEYVLFAGRFRSERRREQDARLDQRTGQRERCCSGRCAHLDYLNRRTASVVASKTRAMPNPSLILNLPAEATEAFIAKVLASPELAAGIWFFEVSPEISARHGQPLQKMPASTVAYELRMQRRASAPDTADYRAMLAANAALIATAMQHGGKVYPPFAPILSAAQWRDHYGPSAWTRFAESKRRFDPNNTLNPSVGIF